MTTYYILSTMPHRLHKWTQFYNNPRAHRAFSEWGNWGRDNLSNITHTTEKDNSRHQVWPLVLPFSLLLADTLTPKNSKDWKRLIPKHIFQRYKYFLLCIISAISQVNTTAESKRFPQGLLCSLYCDTFEAMWPRLHGNSKDLFEKLSGVSRPYQFGRNLTSPFEDTGSCFLFSTLVNLFICVSKSDFLSTIRYEAQF